MDTDVLLALGDSSIFEKYSRFIKRSSVGEETYTILEAMKDWFGFNPTVKEVRWDKFGAWFCMVRHAKMDKTKLDVYRALIARLASSPPPDPESLKPLLEGLSRREFASRIADKALAIVDGEWGTDFTPIEELLDAHKKEVGKIDVLDKHVKMPTLSGMLKVSAPGLQWRLKCLNDALGDLRLGDLIVVGTRPDTGKTTFLAAEATFMAEQLPPEKIVLWVNNEEEGDKVLRRVVQSSLGYTTDKMDSDLEAAWKAYQALYGRPDKIVMLDKADVHIRDVELMLERYDVGLLVFDQLWKVHGFDGEAGNEVTRQTMLFNWAREKAKKTAPVITVHQADGAAEGVKWIDMSRLYGSKTGIQGEADAIITIGRLPEEGNSRYLYVPKNKLHARVPALRNGRFEIEILPDLGRFRER